MKSMLKSVCVAAAMVLLATPLRAATGDSGFLEYRLGDLKILLQGKATVLAGGTMSFRHPKFKKALYFDLRQVKMHKAPTIQQRFESQLRKAESAKSADQVFEAAVWALKHGMLPEYYKAVDKALAIDPKHEDALRIKALKAEMEKPLGDSKAEEEHLRAFVPRSDMRIAKSKHFILLYDTPETVSKSDKEKGARRPRHEERLDLLEQVYESFLLTFFSQGVNLEVPQERLKVVLFQHHADYVNFSTRLDPFLINATGFYTHDANISFFYDHSTDEGVVELQKLSDKLQAVKEDLKKARTGGNFNRFAETIELVVQLYREGQDIEVVSHEATHQLAANTGLFPRHVRVPSWVHEGLAAYFECPNNGAWSGIGAVNELRIGFYRALEPDREHSNIDFIVGDQIFDYAGGEIGNLLHGYGQAWALTHFLMERHFDKFIAYYKQLGEMPPDTHLSPEILTMLWDNVFGTDRTPIDLEWRSYMRSLKTDEEIVLGE